ncbi:MAG: glycosyltransferase family 2 protein [Caldilineaceae bacterium]|nr:glycosyltransferase family 2 protein [Caldilineaceae bacterium]
MSSPRVSVLMAAYNAVSYVETAVDSILQQTFSDFELIVVDDGSTDGTWEILERLAIQDGRIRLERNPKNCGIARTRNRGVELARGEFIAIMDADDISKPYRLEKQSAYLVNHPQVGVVGGAICFFTEGGATPSRVKSFPLTPSLVTWTLCFESPFADPASMIRRSLLVEMEGYRTDHIVAMDYDLWQRLSRIAQLANLPDVVLHYRWHGDNISHRRAEEGNRLASLIAQRAVEAIYGQPIPLDAVKQMLRYHGTPIKDMIVVAQMIDALALRYRAGARLTPADWAAIRADAARRILWLMQHRAENGSMTALAYAARLDPVYAARWSQSMLRQAARRRLLEPRPQ